MSKHAKTPCPGREVAVFGEAAKREQWGDNLTGKQNSSTRLRKSRSGLPSLATADDSHLVFKAPDVSMWTATLTTPECDQVRGPDHTQ